jgi:hypothetical protein
MSRYASVLLLAAVGLGCADTAGWKPVTYPDPGVACPGGQTAWKLEILDRRVDRRDEARTVAIVRDSIVGSFPGCRWEPPDGTARILLEIHRFSSVQEGNTWEARATWTVLASDVEGRSLTEFEVDEEVSRPNYRGSNNARESLREAYDRAVRKTLAGLRSVSSVGLSPPGDTAGGTPARRRRGVL